MKYIKSVLWRVARCLSYIEEARCLKVKVWRVMRELCSVCEEIRNVHKIMVRNLEELSIHARVEENVWVI
jgi:hypothetical protein